MGNSGLPVCASPQCAWHHGQLVPGGVLCSVTHSSNPKVLVASGQGGKRRATLALTAFPAFICATSPGSNAHLSTWMNPCPWHRCPTVNACAGGALIPQPCALVKYLLEPMWCEGNGCVTSCPQHGLVQPRAPFTPERAQESSAVPSWSPHPCLAWSQPQPWQQAPGKSLALCVFSRHCSSILWPEASPKYGLSC